MEIEQTFQTSRGKLFVWARVNPVVESIDDRARNGIELLEFSAWKFPVEDKEHPDYTTNTAPVGLIEEIYAHILRYLDRIDYFK